MSQIALVSNQHNDDVRISMIPQLLQPSCDILVRLVLADIVDQQSSHGSPIVGRCNSTISLLTGSIPNLCLDGLRIYLDRPSRELYTDGRLGIEVELISCESTQQIGFTNTRVSDQNDCRKWKLAGVTERYRRREQATKRAGIGAYP